MEARLMRGFGVCGLPEGRPPGEKACLTRNFCVL